VSVSGREFSCVDNFGELEVTIALAAIGTELEFAGLKHLRLRTAEPPSPCRYPLAHLTGQEAPSDQARNPTRANPPWAALRARGVELNLESATRYVRTL
jgi:hypothetical protein